MVGTWVSTVKFFQTCITKCENIDMWFELQKFWSHTIIWAYKIHIKILYCVYT